MDAANDPGLFDLLGSIDGHLARIAGRRDAEIKRAAFDRGVAAAESFDGGGGDGLRLAVYACVILIVFVMYRNAGRVDTAPRPTERTTDDDL